MKYTLSILLLISFSCCFGQQYGKNPIDTITSIKTWYYIPAVDTVPEYPWMEEPEKELKWYGITKSDYKLIGSSAAFGGFYAVNQAIVHHHLGRGNQFWDINVSWQNKYKDFNNGDTRAKFFLSKSVLVPVTDGFHLTQFAYRAAGLVTLTFAISDFDAYPKKHRWKVVAKKLLICTVSERLMFNTVFALLGSH